ncbi:hypothetical protein [Capnocytophaga stomatis]|uniref:hypothetical protein n=1 Tax=Capnocytophaga stomatis TaxID=1848904 RepID=UPI001BB4595E|nr:hypothetical protein [Capnocytophaga stomatis]
MLKISKLANARAVEIFCASFIDFLNASSPMPVYELENVIVFFIKNFTYTDKKFE